MEAQERERTKYRKLDNEMKEDIYVGPPGAASSAGFNHFRNHEDAVEAGKPLRACWLPVEYRSHVILIASLILHFFYYLLFVPRLFLNVLHAQTLSPFFLP